eukprot:8094813-Lingulodinium_polyedra.AAC.1
MREHPVGVRAAVDHRAQRLQLPDARQHEGLAQRRHLDLQPQGRPLGEEAVRVADLQDMERR